MSIRIQHSELAFSTTWLGSDGGNGSAISKAAQQVGMSRVALGPHLSPEPPERLSKKFTGEKLGVVALYNVFAPVGNSSDYLFGDSLADSRPVEAEKSFLLTLKTAKAARQMGANKVILRLGYHRGEEYRKIHENCCQQYRDLGLTEEIHVALKSGEDKIAKEQEVYLDRVVRIVYQLLKAEPEITFCIENQPAFYQIPDMGSLGYIFEDLRSPRLKYWHNIGNSHIQEKLGLVREGSWLDRFAPFTVGVSMHDANGLDTHLPPGLGEVDFKAIKEALPATCDRVLTLTPETDVEAFKIGLQELRKLSL